MADPLASLEKIVKLALRIKEAVDTVRQNRDECRQIRTRAVRVSSLLSRLPETGMTADPAMCDALEDLEESLRRAHTLVAACQDQESTTVCIYCTARRQARRLRRVQDDISQKVMLVVFATNIQTTIVLTSIVGTAETGRPAEQAGGEMIETPVVDPCGPPADEARPISGSGCWVPPRRSAGKMRRFLHHLGLCPLSRNTGTFQDSSTQEEDLLLTCLAMAMDQPLAPPLKPATLWIDIPNERKKATKTSRKFSLSALEAATHHFSMENMIGSGASATVYKGILQDGLVVAIKKVRNQYVRSAEHIDEYHRLVSKLKHKNIVKLIGYGTGVLERAEQFGDAKEDTETSYFFVEEYMPNGSLNKIINGLQLGWTTLFLVIQGIAQGLCYLHRKNVVHLDVKPSNILLDSDMYPKITDFGIATVLNRTGVDIRSHIDTIAGTLGYMPPEYITNGTLSKKHDVYGFGVTLLEVISGMSRIKRAGSQCSIQWAWEARQAGGMTQLLEPSLFDTPQLKEIKRCVEVGLLCTQFDPADRPDMVGALQMVRGEKALRIPVRPRYTKELTNWFGGLSCLQVRL